jgi:multiple sugar transport system substrate-binding protein
MRFKHGDAAADPAVTSIAREGYTFMDSSRSNRLWSRRTFLKISASSAGLLMVSACGNSDPAAPTQAGTATQSPLPSAASTATSTASFQDKGLNVMMIQPHAVASQVLAADFEAATGAKVNVTLVPYDQVQENITLDVQSEAHQFDVFTYWYPTLGALASQNIAEDLTAFSERAEINAGDFIPSLYDPYTLYKGRRYGLPFDGDSHVLFYNKEIFDRHGLSAPTTWDDYLNAANIITTAERKQNIYGCAVLGSPTPMIIGSSYSNRLAGFGGSFLNSRGRSSLDNEAALQAAQAMLDITPHALPTPLDTAFDQAISAFLNGKVAMMEFWTDLGVFAQDPNQSKIVDKWDVVQMPIGGKNTKHISPLNAGFALAISRGSQQKELAQAFIQFASSKETGIKLLTTSASGVDPIRKSTLESSDYASFAPKVQKTVSASLNGAFSWPNSENSPELMTKLSSALERMLSGMISPQQAMSQVHKEWQALLGS